MSGDQVRLANGETWTWQQFLQHYVNHPPATQPSPVIVDRNWYMDEGPGRYYHPRMFPIIRNVVDRHDLSPGTYDLWQLAPNGGNDSSVKALISHYKADTSSEDHWTRQFVFGNESARISGQAVINPDGSKTFQNVEIRPYDTDFNFQPLKTTDWKLEAKRIAASVIYDPLFQGTSYDIKFPPEGRGRVYYPFTDSQVNATPEDPLDKPPGLLPSVASAPPPFLDQYQQYLNQMRIDPPPLAAGQPGSSPFDFTGPGAPGGGIVNWFAGLTGTDPMNPGQPALQPSDRPLGIFSNQPMPDWPIPPPIFNTR